MGHKQCALHARKLKQIIQAINREMNLSVSLNKILTDS